MEFDRPQRSSVPSERDPSSEYEFPSSNDGDGREFLRNNRPRWKYGLGSRIHHDLVILWLYATIGTIYVVLCLFLLVFLLLPRSTTPITSQNFISNNPIETDGKLIDGVSKWLEDFSRSAIPVMCHSHNDYTRPYPLFSALAAGCASVEADVWLSSDGKDLLVGHNKRSLSSKRTLRSLYIDPLLEILDTMNPSTVWSNLNRTDQAFGVFRTQAEMTLILFIDVKDDPSETWPLVLQQLEPLRQKLFLSRHERIHSAHNVLYNQTFWPGPVTVVGTGNILERRDVNIGFDRSEWLKYHDAFLDAPLDGLAALENEDSNEDTKTAPGRGWLENEFYTASVSFWSTIGSVHTGFTKSQLAKLKDQIQAAQERGLKARYWGFASWPISHRDYIWRVLIREGIDLLNADDIQSAAKRDWSHGYARESIWMCTVSAYLLCTSVGLAWLGHRKIQESKQQSIRV
ncbi:Fc.00g093930.m01.CDS01 [Cosmosporella sp. VM-42]